MSNRERQFLRLMLAMFVTALATGWQVKQLQQSAAQPVPSATIYRITSAPSTTTSSTTTSTTTTSSAPSTTTTLLAGEWLCPEMVTIAASVGWPATELATLDMVMHRESRCQPDAHAGPENGPAFARDDSYGLLQINVKGSLWAARQAVCGLSRRATLFLPAVNLACGLRLWEQSGWAPWGL